MQCIELVQTQRKDDGAIGVQVISIDLQIGVLTCNEDGIDMQRHKGALGRANPMILDDLSRSIVFGELPSAVASQAMQLLARGNAQCTAKLAVCTGRVSACAKWGNQW